MLAQTDIARRGFSMSRPFVPSNAEARDAARIEESAAIEACLAGDTSAFDVLVIRHQKSIQRVCYRFTGNAEDAADLTQEVFVKAYRSLPKFRGTSAFSTWLYRIAVNACLTFKAARKNRTEEWDEDQDIVAEGPGVDEVVDAAMSAQAVRAALETLPEKQKLTVIMKVLEERTHAEVAEILGSNVGTVKANLFFAVRNLRKQLAATLGGRPRADGQSGPDGQ
ncbi:MAG: sigma-70 family RNA polymerase sigma factor [Vicinamibacteria bacterium]|nr:sigma-70 family RNA polymerase sigma factor [Vicinamibacteria bacterium]MBP9947726.1 sigma-70 family RNA polymerase sigma factor [Vicinamibacteria bacterium]